MSLNNLDAIKLRMTLEDTHVDIADEWISEVVSLQQKLAAERTKVAQLEEAFRQSCHNYNTLLDDAVEMRSQISAERAKVALAIEALRCIGSNTDDTTAVALCRKILAALQSSDALAEHDAEVRKLERDTVVSFLKDCLLKRKERLLRQACGHPVGQQLADCIQGEIDGIGTDYFWSKYEAVRSDAIRAKFGAKP